MVTKAAWICSIAAVAATLLSVVGAATAASSRSNTDRARAIEGQLGAGYNQVAKSKGAIAGMAYVRVQALARIGDVPSSERREFARAVLVWANEMRFVNYQLQASFDLFRASRLGPLASLAGSVPAQHAYVETAISSYKWNGRAVSRVTCRGVWNGGTIHLPVDGYFFTDFRCSFVEHRRGSASFRLHVVDRSTEITESQWRDSWGSTTGSGSGSGNGVACKTDGVTLKQLIGVECETAIEVYSAYVNSGVSPTGWTCAPRRCDGPPDFTDLPSSFIW
jgi:hypothetical protein